MEKNTSDTSPSQQLPLPSPQALSAGGGLVQWEGCEQVGLTKSCHLTYKLCVLGLWASCLIFLSLWFLLYSWKWIVLQVGIVRFQETMNGLSAHFHPPEAGRKGEGR